MMATRLALRNLRTPVVLSCKRITAISPKFLATTTCVQTVESNSPPEKTLIASSVLQKIGDSSDDNIDPHNLLHDVGAEMNVESIMMMNHTENAFDVDDFPDIDIDAPNITQSGYEPDDMLLDDLEVTKDEEVHLRAAGDEMNVESVMMNSANGDSEEYDDYHQTDDEIRNQILGVALENVPIYGWTSKSIEKAVEDLELSPSSSDLFKRGAVDLVMFFIEEGNNALVEHLAKEAEKTNLTTEDARSEFIEKAIKTRLQMIIPYIDTWPDAMKLMASPIATKEVFENGANLLDEILYHAGDFSTDMSWYAKRGVLAAINVSTELHMLNDKSLNYQDTWSFLHRRMQDGRMLHFAKDSVTNAASDTMALASAGISLAQNILGMNDKRR